MMNDVETLSAEPMIICARCCHRLPESAFRRRSKASARRMRQCKTCHAAYERQRRQTHRQQSAGLALQKSATAIARAPNIERLTLWLDLLTKQFGGPHQFYDFWHKEIERLKTTRRHGFRLLRFLEMLSNLECLVEQSRGSRDLSGDSLTKA